MQRQLTGTRDLFLAPQEHKLRTHTVAIRCPLALRQPSSSVSEAIAPSAFHVAPSKALRRQSRSARRPQGQPGGRCLRQILPLRRWPISRAAGRPQRTVESPDVKRPRSSTSPRVSLSSSQMDSNRLSNSCRQTCWRSAGSWSFLRGRLAYSETGVAGFLVMVSRLHLRRC